MIFYQIKAGGDRNFAYLAAGEGGGKAALFDPPQDLARIFELLEKHSLIVEYIILTHGHSDHTGGALSAADRLKCKTAGHKSIPIAVDLPLEDGDTLPLGDLTLDIIHTPGHTGDSICILCGTKLVTGDTLFVADLGSRVWAFQLPVGE